MGRKLMWRQNGNDQHTLDITDDAVAREYDQVTMAEGTTGSAPPDASLGEALSAVDDDSERSTSSVVPTSRLSVFGRPFRVLAGCDDRTLALCPHEQIRYAGYGAVVLGTATL